jgi:formylglycine-generating enzyme required for sulfatase activity
VDGPVPGGRNSRNGRELRDLRKPPSTGESVEALAAPRVSSRWLSMRRVFASLLAAASVVGYGAACIRTEFGPLVFLCDPSGSAKCPDGTFCAKDGLCRDERCQNGVQDGYESDVDCGAFCGPCGFGQRCGGASDCSSRTCVPGATIPGKETAARCLCPADQAAVTAGDKTACIDLDEVTNQAYLDFLGRSPPPTPAASERCSGNTSLEPATGGGCPTLRQADRANLPVVCVDFCDAEAFCAANGKTLCGAFDGTALKGATSRVDPSESVWTAACTDGGRRDYPYTDNKPFTPNECVDQYPSPFVPSEATTTISGCAGLRDNCCAFRPDGALRTACYTTVTANNAAACSAAEAKECTTCTALGRCCDHLTDTAARATCRAASAAGDEKVCADNANLCGCAALSSCCLALAKIPERGEQAVGCQKTLATNDDTRCRADLALFCPSFDESGKTVEQPLQPVGRASGCATRVGQPADLSGNAGEWEDNCDVVSGTAGAGGTTSGAGGGSAGSKADESAPNALCTIRGGSILGATSCKMATWRVPRSTTQADIGFRCCSH